MSIQKPTRVRGQRKPKILDISKLPYEEYRKVKMRMKLAEEKDNAMLTRYPDTLDASRDPELKPQEPPPTQGNPKPDRSNPNGPQSEER